MPPNASSRFFRLRWRCLLSQYLALYAISPDFNPGHAGIPNLPRVRGDRLGADRRNYRAGGFGPLVERIDPTYAYISTRNPAVIPQYPLLAVFGAVGLFLFIKARLKSRWGS